MSDSPPASTANEESSAFVSRIVLEGLCGAFRPESYGEFRPLWPGVDILPLYGFAQGGDAPPPSGPSAALIRYLPGASVPSHRHAGYEHIIVLSGSQSDEQDTYPQGTCLISAPGSQHRVRSEEGCLVLAIWTHPIEVLDES